MPITTDRGGTTIPGGTTAPAAITHSSPTTLPDSSFAPMPTSVSGPDAHAVQHRRVPDHDARLDHVRHAEVAVNDHAVLQVDVLAERDRGHVAADDHPVPEVHARAAAVTSPVTTAVAARKDRRVGGGTSPIAGPRSESIAVYRGGIAG